MLQGMARKLTKEKQSISAESWTQLDLNSESSSATSQLYDFTSWDSIPDSEVGIS